MPRSPRCICDVLGAPSFRAGSPSSLDSLICDQVTWIHPPRLTFNVWLLQHGCFHTDVTDVEQSSATLSDLGVYLHIFKEGTKQMGSSYFLPSMFVLTVFQWKPMCLVWPPPPFFLNGIRIVVDLKTSFLFFCKVWIKDVSHVSFLKWYWIVLLCKSWILWWHYVLLHCFYLCVPPPPRIFSQLNPLAITPAASFGAECFSRSLVDWRTAFLSEQKRTLGTGTRPVFVELYLGPCAPLAWRRRCLKRGCMVRTRPPFWLA